MDVQTFVAIAVQVIVWGAVILFFGCFIVPIVMSIWAMLVNLFINCYASGAKSYNKEMAKIYKGKVND